MNGIGILASQEVSTTPAAQLEDYDPSFLLQFTFFFLMIL